MPSLRIADLLRPSPEGRGWSSGDDPRILQPSRFAAPHLSSDAKGRTGADVGCDADDPRRGHAGRVGRTPEANLQTVGESRLRRRVAGRAPKAGDAASALRGVDTGGVRYDRAQSPVIRGVVGVFAGGEEIRPGSVETRCAREGALHGHRAEPEMVGVCGCACEQAQERAVGMAGETMGPDQREALPRTRGHAIGRAHDRRGATIQTAVEPVSACAIERAPAEAAQEGHQAKEPTAQDVFPERVQDHPDHGAGDCHAHDRTRKTKRDDDERPSRGFALP